MESISFTIPFLPPSLNAYRRRHWREQRRIERMWKEAVFVRWLELGRPTCSEASVTLRFLFPDRRSRDLDNYLATGSKLVGDAIKGRFIQDDSPRHLKGWRFFFGVDRGNPKTIVEMREVSLTPPGGGHPLLAGEEPGHPKDLISRRGRRVTEKNGSFTAHSLRSFKTRSTPSVKGLSFS